MSTWEAYLEENKGRFLEELIEFLRIPSISSFPEHADDVMHAAEWVAARLKAVGLENIAVMPTGGHPVVYGDWLHAADKPTVIIYGHFDIQPVDPLEEWTNPPFEPTVKDNRIYARGAADNKGNSLAPMLALEALLKTEGKLPLNVKCLFEGQEEIGSPQLPEFIAGQKEFLKCDLAISADGSQWEEDQPAIKLGLRGVCALQIDVRGARRDAHSGAFGGTFANPIHALAEIIASMRRPDGKILVDGFDDDVITPGEWEREQIAAVPFDEAGYLKELGLEGLFGEPGFNTYERMWIRPTLEVNGIWGGFQGEGNKTVIPSQAHAKITCRLVPNQDPIKINALLKKHIGKNAPQGVKVNVQLSASSADPYVIAHDHPGNQAARAVHQVVYGKEPYYIRVGGSIPICGILKKHLGASTVNFAFGLKDERTHAPDEFFRLSSFERSQKAYCLLLEELASRKL